MDDRRAVFTLHAAVAAAIAVTQSRDPGRAALQHPPRRPLPRGRVRLLPDGGRGGGAPLPRPPAPLRLAALPLCATVAVPGVVDERHLDVRPRNLPALAGVALAVLPPARRPGRRRVAAGRGRRPRWRPPGGAVGALAAGRAPACRPPACAQPRRPSRASTASTSATTRASTACCWPGTAAAARRHARSRAHRLVPGADAHLRHRGRRAGRLARAGRQARLGQPAASRRRPAARRRLAWAALLAATPLVGGCSSARSGAARAAARRRRTGACRPARRPCRWRSPPARGR